MRVSEMSKVAESLLAAFVWDSFLYRSSLLSALMRLNWKEKKRMNSIASFCTVIGGSQ